MSNMGISSLPDYFWSLSYLETLKLSGNNLVSLPSLVDMKSLTTLEVSNNVNLRVSASEFDSQNFTTFQCDNVCSTISVNGTTCTASSNCTSCISNSQSLCSTAIGDSNSGCSWCTITAKCHSLTNFSTSCSCPSQTKAQCGAIQRSNSLCNYCISKESCVAASTACPSCYNVTSSTCYSGCLTSPCADKAVCGDYFSLKNCAAATVKTGCSWNANTTICNTLTATKCPQYTNQYTCISSSLAPAGCKWTGTACAAIAVTTSTDSSPGTIVAFSLSIPVAIAALIALGVLVQRRFPGVNRDTNIIPPKSSEMKELRNSA
eukprot:TRINITY_DN6235_c0_g1_i1.p1 TRINITY_DN6235_c0_g1~~TRINITY_DN6235_c0_g1_i1.p1  ORF type:complete len:319 (+),score=84.67 TRINITY_DN6235_c0_g1_i1:377-1333(+)